MLNDPALNCPVLVGQDGVNPSPGSGPFRGVTQSAFKQGEVKIDTNQLLTNKVMCGVEVIFWSCKQSNL